MTKLTWLLCPLALLLALLLSQTPPSVAQAPAPIDAAEDHPKIDRWVLDQTAAGQTAEFLVVLDQRAELRGADRLPTKIAKGRYVYATLFAHARRTQRPLVAWLQQRGVEYRSFYIVNAIWVRADRATALALAARSDVARLDGNPLSYTDLAQPAKPIGPQPERAESIEPGLQYVNAPQVWNLGATGQGIVIGGQDTGYRWDHDALKVQYRGWDGITVTHDYHWHDSIHTNTHGVNLCGYDSPLPCDDYGHGTHTMGTLVGDDGGANQVGMAPGAQWIGCRNMDNGWGTPATYLECFEFFLAPYPVNGTPAQGDPDRAPDVTNNSWSCPSVEGCNAASLLEAVQAQRAAGMLTVVSATNGSSACSSISDPPAIYAEAYVVGALNTGTDDLASFSNRGPVTSDGSGRRKPDITAPGTGIRSSTNDGGYGLSGGTSMAAPHVAGAVALLWSAHPALRNEITFTEQLLNQSAAHISSTACGSSGWPNNSFGYGRLDVAAAVMAVGSATQTAAPGAVVTYTLLITNTAATTETFTLSAGRSNWPATISPTTKVNVLPAQAFTATVAVSIPVQAAFLASDALAIAAVPAEPQSPWFLAALTTRVESPWRAFLPIILR